MVVGDDDGAGDSATAVFLIEEAEREREREMCAWRGGRVADILFYFFVFFKFEYLTWAASSPISVSERTDLGYMLLTY